MTVKSVGLAAKNGTRSRKRQYKEYNLANDLSITPDYDRCVAIY